MEILEKVQKLETAKIGILVKEMAYSKKIKKL